MKEEVNKKSEAIKKDSSYIRGVQAKMQDFDRLLHKHDQLYEDFMHLKNKIYQKDEELKSKDLQIQNLKK